MRIYKSGLTAALVSILAAATFAVGSPGTAFADDSTTTTTEVATALDKADARNNALVATATSSITDSDSAAQTASVDIPADPTKGVKLTTPAGNVLTIGVPGAKFSGKGQKTRKGLVAYSGKNGSANAVVPTDNGGVQFLTTIESRKAPTTFDYPVTLPEGGKIEVSDAGAGAVVYDAQNQPQAAIAAPWAKDANGKAVKSWLTTDGKVLTQHVQHRVSGVAYPVVADPWWIPISAAVVVAAFTAGVWACGLGYLGGMAWEIFWNGWVWQQVRQAGREGCVEGVVARFLPVSWFRAVIKRG